MVSVSIVIAAYNEEQSLPSVFERCWKVLRRCSDEHEIVILDDGSTDATAEVMERIRRAHPGIVRTLAHERNEGIARTFEDLYRAARKEWVFDVPADGEYPPEALIEMMPMLSEYDIIVCSRKFKRYTPYRRLVSWFYRWVPRALFGIDLHDPGSSKCRRREVIREISVSSKGVFVEAERVIRAVRRGYRYGKVDVSPEPRGGGTARGARPRLVVQAAWDLLLLWLRLVVVRQPP